MAGIEDLLKNLPIGDIAKQLGVGTDEAGSAIQQALPALLAGMQANAKDDAGAKSLEKALKAHANDDVKNVKVEHIDTNDGKKIVRNIFGDNTDQVVNSLAAQDSNKGSNIIGDLLPVLAPVVLGFVANQFSKKDDSKEEQGGGIADMLGGLLGGGNSSSNDSNPLGDIIGGLGGLFGGGDNKNSSGGGDLLGNLLGGLLGGGKR